MELELPPQVSPVKEQLASYEALRVHNTTVTGKDRDRGRRPKFLARN
jgi:hypothetical protein